MESQPPIVTERLLLRPFVHEDAADVRRLAGDVRVAQGTLTVPHPYPEGIAECWIATHEAAWESGCGAVFAITLKAGGVLLGTAGLTVRQPQRAAELGYWLGVPYWGHGYCTEAARALVDFAFACFAVERVHAHHFARNSASGRVLRRIGMEEEFFRRGGVVKAGVAEDIRGYALTRARWESLRGLH